MVGLSLLIAVGTAAAPLSTADFYLLIQECGTTVASFLPEHRVVTAVRPAEDEDLKHCSRKGEELHCWHVFPEGLVDDPLGPDKYRVVLDEGSTLAARSDSSSASITVSAARRVGITIVMGNSPATSGPDVLDAVATLMCRGAIGTAADVKELRQRRVHK